MVPLGGREAVGHPTEHHRVDRGQRIPVGPAEQAPGSEPGALLAAAALSVREHVPLEPGTTRHPHVGSQRKEPVGLEAADAPRVDDVAQAQSVGVTAALARSGTTDQQIERAAEDHSHEALYQLRLPPMRLRRAIPSEAEPLLRGTSPTSCRLARCSDRSALS
jgi:hypothetical protein